MKSRAVNRSIQHYDFVAVSECWDFQRSEPAFGMMTRSCDGRWRVGEAGAPIESFPVGLIGSEKLHAVADHIRRF